MKHYFQTAKDTILNNREATTIAAAAIASVVILVVILFLAVRGSTPNIVYTPATACKLFTKDEAKELLGSSVINSNNQQPTISKDTAISNCGYTDGNPNTDAMLVAALTVRSGINEEGVKQNKAEFKSGKPTEHIKTIQNLGDDAYFNEKVGQLNILDDHNWIILSYGQGSAPEQNTLTKATELARLVIDQTPITSRF